MPMTFSMSPAFFVTSERTLLKGTPNNGSEEMKWMTDLLCSKFAGREGTSNACDETFRNMGTLIRSGLSILIERALIKNMLHSGSAEETISWFDGNYPKRDMRRGTERNHRRELVLGKKYKIIYQDRSTVKTDMTIEFRERKRRYFVEFCHLRNALRAFKRTGLNVLSFFNYYSASKDLRIRLRYLHTF